MPRVPSLVDELAAYAGAPYPVTVTGGWRALQVALRGVDVRPGDEVIVPALGAAAAVAATVACGARPRVADVDADSGCLTAATIAPLLGVRTRAVVAVHFGGWPVDLDPLLAVTDAAGVSVVEDCSAAHGATTRGRRVGSLGHAAAWLSCAEVGLPGLGLVATCDPDVLDRAAALTPVTLPPQRRPDTVALRARLLRHRTWAAALAARLDVVPALRMPAPPPGAAASRLHAYLDPAALQPRWTRDALVPALAAAGVPCLPGPCDTVWRAPAAVAAVAPVAAALAATGIALRVPPTGDPDDVATRLVDVVTAATRVDPAA